MKHFKTVLGIALFLIAYGCGGDGTDRSIAIRFEDNAQVELSSSNKDRVLIDVYDPARLSSPATSRDILLTTHSHWDHMNPAFFEKFPGLKLSGPGELSTEGIRIRGVLTSHFSIPEHPISPEHRNVTYVIERNGLRIAHFGDNWQLSLDENQLRAIGRVDIAVASLVYDPKGYIDPGGFGPLLQVKPKLIIPAHMGPEAGKHALALWKGFRTEGSSVTVRLDDLKGGTRILFMGKNAQTMRGLPEWGSSKNVP